MKILIDTFTYPPEANGVSHVAHAHALGFAKRGHEVTVVTSICKKREHKQIEKENIRVVQFNVKGSGNIRQGYSGDIKKYQEFIANAKVDVMFFHCWQIWSTDLAIPAFVFNKAKKILISHGVSANSFLSPRYILNWICWRPYIWKMPNMLRAFDHIVFLSQQKDKDRFYDYYLAEKIGFSNFTIIPNGSHPINSYKSKTNFKKKYEISASFLVLHIASYDFVKNQKMALKAFIQSDMKDTAMVFIGNKKNNYLIKLKAFVDKNKLSNNIFFLEGISRKDIIAAYLSADIFICSSLSEVQPLSILDAMSAGVPFVSTDVGCVSDFSGGLIVRNQCEMAENIRMLIENKSLRNKLGEEGQRVCNSYYSWADVLDKYEFLLNKTIVK